MWLLLSSHVVDDPSSWELDSKMLDTVYRGLALRPTLQSLTISFASERTPRPTTVIPPMANLRHLKVMNIDPLCYPDDISVLLLHSKNLRELQLHWSERMRIELEPSVNLSSYFGKCIAAKYTLPVRSVGFQNLYALPVDGFETVFDKEEIRSITYLNSFETGGEDTLFLDQLWLARAKSTAKRFSNLKVMRGDRLSKAHAELLGTMTGLEELYYVNEKHARGANGSRRSTPGSTLSPDVASNASTPSQGNVSSLGRDYIDSITRGHGQTLKILLLSDKWKLGQQQLALLVRSCPNLEQLGLALEKHNFDLLSILLPFLPNIYAVRLLDDAAEPSYQSIIDGVNDATHRDSMGHDMYERNYRLLRYIGLGSEKVFEIGKEVVECDRVGDAGERLYKRPIWWVPRQVIENYPLWAMDSPDL
ncbi:MAG: hypothetical protein M1837_000599 [Sclerophora amabilis]|nr:MAG: hypothetical protein M1837_000599 [Sclerophora amabilis]